jgi:hypothetical protein
MAVAVAAAVLTAIALHLTAALVEVATVLHTKALQATAQLTLVAGAGVMVMWVLNRVGLVAQES